MNPKVEPYDPVYRDQVLDLVEQFHAYSLEEYGAAFDRESIVKYEETHGDTTFLLIDDEKVIGILGGQLGTQPTSERKVYQEHIWYVDKNNRGHGKLLFSYLENWCLVNGIDQIIMAYLHNSMSDRLYDFYVEMGYKPIETHLIKDVN